MGVAHREQSTLNTVIMGVDPVEAKSLRKRNKRLARELAEEAAETVEADAKEEPVETVEVAPSNAEAKRLRKAAKKAAKKAAAPEAAEDEDEGVPLGKTAPEPAAEVAPATEVSPTCGSEALDEAAAEAKRVKIDKKARLRAKKAKATGVDVPEPEKAKRDAQDQDDVAPKAKKSKTESGESSSKEVVHKSDDAFKVFVRGLPWSIDEDALRTHFGKCGVIEDIKMPKTSSGSLRGLAFIKFTTQEGFDAALNLDDTQCGGRAMNVAKVEKKEGKGQGKEAVSLPRAMSNELTVFIRGLSFEIEEAGLRKDFEECGAIEKITLPMNPEGKPKGICFIKFLDAAGLDAALKFDNTEYGGRTINVHRAEDGHKGKGKDGKSKGKDSKGKSKGKDGKSKGKDGKGKSKGKGKDGDD